MTRHIDIDAVLEIALHLDAVLVAFERRAAGKLVHRPVDARVLADIASCVNLDGVARPDDVNDWITILEQRITQLGVDKRKLLVDALVRDSRLAPWRPNRGSQCLSFELAAEVDVMLDAGSAGSGKTEGAVGTALLQHRVARFMRGTALELAPVLRRIGEIVGSTEGRNQGTSTWSIDAPFGYGARGVTIEWGGLSEPDARLRWQGRPHDLLVIDDAGSGTVRREDVDYVSRWLRSTEQGLKKLLLFTSNAPSSRDSLWLRDELFRCWLSPHYDGKPAASGEVRYFVARGDTDVEVPAGTPGAQARTVVRSRTSDNVRLVRSGYLTQLRNAPTELLRRRLADDDWTAGWDTDASDQVIPGSWVEAAMDRWHPVLPNQEMMGIGVDVGRTHDNTVISRRFANWHFDKLIVIPGSETVDGPMVAGQVITHMRDRAPVHVDAIGVGASVYDFLRNAGIFALGINVANAAPGLDKTGTLEFVNYRSWLWWRMRELLDPQSNLGVMLPRDERLLQDLTAPRYSLRGRRIYVEGRDDLLKRLGRSPDFASALLLATLDTPKLARYDEERARIPEHDPYAYMERRWQYDAYSGMRR